MNLSPETTNHRSVLNLDNQWVNSTLRKGVSPSCLPSPLPTTTTTSDLGGRLPVVVKSRDSGVQTLAPLFSGYVIWGKLQNLPRPQFPHLENGGNAYTYT